MSAASLLILFTINLSAQTDGLDLSYIENKQLSINLTTRILGEENETIWHMNSSNVTVSGEAVKVKLTGDRLVVIANITPYLNSDNTLFLVAKGEIFMTDSADSEEVKYYTTLKSLPVKVGEKVVFFPLGMAYDSNSNFYSMEMEIQVLSVEDSGDSAKVE
ncbi:MAG TPA: hypothetical protein DCO79_08650 [Spirochaeta sp.]|nr:hypothetical protein [Spirochaeta sp.]